MCNRVVGATRPFLGSHSAEYNLMFWFPQSYPSIWRGISRSHWLVCRQKPLGGTRLFCSLPITTSSPGRKGCTHRECLKSLACARKGLYFLARFCGVQVFHIE